MSEDIPALWVDAVHFEGNAKALCDASRVGEEKPLTAVETKEFSENFKRTNHAVKLWRYFLARSADARAIPHKWASELIPTERA